MAVWQRLCALPVLLQDAWLYLLSAIFAMATAFVAVSADYREWGEMAGVAYLLAGVVSLQVSARDRRGTVGPHTVSYTRRGLVGLLVLGAVLVPLVFELTWRAEAKQGAHAQPEVAVIERAGDRAAAGKDPYLSLPNSVGISPSNDAVAVDADAYFPYLPGMVPFGLINATSAPPEIRDARVTLASFTLVVVALALVLSGASAARRGRAVQFFVVLPTAALPMVTGGDDLPVLALLFLGLVLAVRRQPVWAGIVLGLAGTLKFTAWPLLLLLLLAVRDREGRRAPLRYGLSLAIALPVVAVGFLIGPSAFIENVVRFPLGFAHVKSPAASPLLGQVLVNAFPDHRTLITLVMGVVGAAVVATVFVRHRPRSPAAVARFTAFALTVATVLAPATRFGYLIYPANLIVCAYVLDEMEQRQTLSDQLAQFASPTSSSVSSTLLDSAAAPLPASAGVMEGFAGSTTTPTSQ
jgi:hypothetical protein